MDSEDDYTTEELVNLKVFTVDEAKQYVKDKTGMGDGLFNECVRPELKFHPLVKNYKRKRFAYLVIPKKEVDKVIAKWKKKLIERYRQI